MNDFIQGIERILVLRTDGIGDVLNSTPAISALREAYRDACISVAARPPGAEILLLNPHIDEVLVYDTDDVHKSLSAKLQFIRHLRSGRYDMVVILYNSSQCNLMAYLSGARYRIGRKSGHNKRFNSTLTHSVRTRYPKGTKHEIDRNMDVVRLVGAKGGERDLILNLSEEERRWAQDFLQRQSIGADHVTFLVGIHPGASTFDRVWPVENFAYVANELARKFDTKIMLFSGPGEDALARNIQRKIVEQGRKLRLTTPEVLFAAGLRLRQFAALVEKCSLFICNDSGPMHIAAALKVPMVAVFGPGDHVRWEPRGEKAVVVRRDMDCWPCSVHKCKKEFECIKTLPASSVLNAAYSILT